MSKIQLGELIVKEPLILQKNILSVSAPLKVKGSYTSKNWSFDPSDLNWNLKNTLFTMVRRNLRENNADLWGAYVREGGCCKKKRDLDERQHPLSAWDTPPRPMTRHPGYPFDWISTLGSSRSLGAPNMAQVHTISSRSIDTLGAKT